MTEQLLNVAWLSIAAVSFAVVVPSVRKDRRMHAVVLLGAVLALLFPIISISDDLNVDWSAQEIIAVLSVSAVVVMAFGVIALLGAAAPRRVDFATVDLSDPRSPPRV